MIVITPLNGEPIIHFEDYNDLFDCITTIENMKLLARHPDDRYRDWSFTIYPPEHVLALYAYSENPSESMKEAVDEKLPLVEICIGDSQNPQRIILTPNVDIDHLKKKWCIDYCTWHHLLVREG